MRAGTGSCPSPTPWKPGGRRCLRPYTACVYKLHYNQENGTLSIIICSNTPFFPSSADFFAVLLVNTVENPVDTVEIWWYH